MPTSPPENTHGTPLRTDEVARLLQLNRYLKKMEALLKTVTATLRPALAAKIANPADPMGDYELEAQMHYTLREDDTAWRGDSDNFLTSRQALLKHGCYQLANGADHRVWMPRMEALNTEPHCWSFNDLWENEYGPDNPSVPLRDCLRLGSVWVEVVIRQQYCLHLDSGEWVQENHPSLEKE